MTNLSSIKYRYLAGLILILFISCDKELSGFGNYAIGINNFSIGDCKLEVFVDGKLTEQVKIKGQQEASYMGDCAALMKNENLQNVIVLKHIPEGAHHIELKDKDSNPKFETNIYIRSDACVTQNVTINL
jgi:hypothetical protein